MLTFALALLAAAAVTFVLWERVRHGRQLKVLTRELEVRVAERAARLEPRANHQPSTDETRGSFLARVSHEMRTPLSGMLGVTQLLINTGLEGRQRELAEIVRAQGGTLLTILNDILDYSKMEAGRFGLAPANFPLRGLIDEAVEVFGEQARVKQIGLDIHIDPSLPDIVHGDSVRLRQVLDNLLSNAVKFTSAGSIVLRVDRFAATTPVVVARFEVADTGIGIGPDAARVLFQPFMQAEPTTAARRGGTGLGLAIAKSLVGLMGGEIGCRPQAGGGSTFWFTARLSEAVNEVPAASDVVNESEPSRVMSGCRVLVAEDNEINRMVTVTMLEDAGCGVDAVGSGVEAVAACARGHYDLLVMDCRMPEMDGYQAAREIRRAEVAGRRVPIVALTAHALDGEAERCAEAGMDDCVTKPIDEATIARLLTRWTISGAVRAETLDDLERRSPAVLRTVIDHYVSGIPTDMANLRTAVARGDRDRVHAMAHDLAGSALVVGARQLAALLREAERTGEALSLDPWLASVEAEHRRVLQALHQRSRRATSSSQC